MVPLDSGQASVVPHYGRHCGTTSHLVDGGKAGRLMDARECRRKGEQVAKRAARYRRLEKLLPTTDMFFASAVASWEIAAQLAELNDKLGRGVPLVSKIERGC